MSDDPTVGGSPVNSDSGSDTGGDQSGPVDDENRIIALNIISPAAQAELQGLVSLEASCNLSDEISELRFFLDNNELGIAEKRACTAAASVDVQQIYSYDWDTTSIADGSYTLVAKARDSTGDEIVSPEVTVTVCNTFSDENDSSSGDGVDSGSATDTTDKQASTSEKESEENSPPVVEITSPLPEAVLKGISTIEIAISEKSSIEEIKFYLDNHEIPEIKASDEEVVVLPDERYGLSFDLETATVLDGNYELIVKIYDADGNESISEEVPVSINNSSDLTARLQSE